MPTPQDSEYWQIVPAQSFQMGISHKEARALVIAHTARGLTPERLSDEQELHHVDLQSFFLAKTPLSCQAYKYFLDQGGYTDLKLHRQLINETGPHAKQIIASWVDDSGAPGPSSWSNGSYPDGHELHPVHGICFYEALACAQFFEARLPTEAEWECAARTPDNRHFPWGNEIDTPNVANFKWNQQQGTTVIGSYPDGDSALGLKDLAGNVHEWTSSIYEAYPEGKIRYRFGGKANARVLRGGAFNGDLWDLRTSSRFAVNPELRFDGLGVRLAKDSEEN